MIFMINQDHDVIIFLWSVLQVPIFIRRLVQVSGVDAAVRPHFSCQVVKQLRLQRSELHQIKQIAHLGYILIHGSLGLSSG